ncbi:MAG: hypothetical protein M3N07_00125 [Pseudomonadota bacterium]|nr:hypothetical protein [Pseudomonadota bacterium]
MTALGLIGIFLGALAFRLAFIGRTFGKILLLAAAYALHVAAAFVYYRRTEADIADTYGYYYDPMGMYGEGFGLGTQFIVFAVQSIKHMVGGTYLDYFFLFQALGYAGICLLMRVADEIYSELGLRMPPYLYLLLFVPSLHFWSSAVGKDAPFLFSAVLAIWSSMRLPQRLLGLVAALLLMLLIRPHIFLVAVAALALAAMAGRGVRAHVRVALFVAASAGVAFAISAVQETFNIDVTSSESVMQQLERREGVLQTEDAGNTSVNAAYPVRLLSLLFRPLFFDAQGLFGLISSMENLAILLLVSVILFRIRFVAALVRNIVYIRFTVIFTLMLILFLALAYYNVGLGLRQKWTMVMPGLFVVLITLLCAQARRRSDLRARAAIPFPPGVVQGESFAHGGGGQT